MELNSSQLTAFAAVAKLLNFTKAADSLNITQSALSQRIAKLEDELCTTLLVRDRSLIRLTEAGEQVLRYYQRLEAAEADYIFTNKKSESENIQSIFLGHEEYVLVKSKKSPDTEIYLDHDEEDQTTKNYFFFNKIPFKPFNIRYLDDVYGLIDGVKNSYGKAILPLHLIENEPSLEIVDPQKTLRVSVYLQFFVHPFYRRLHTQFINEIQTYFKDRLRQEK